MTPDVRIHVVQLAGTLYHCRACGWRGVLRDAIRHVVQMQWDARPLWMRTA